MTGVDPEREQARLAALSDLDLLGGVSFPDLDRLVKLVADICDANIAAFTVHDSTLAHQISTSYGVVEPIPREECMCSDPLARGETVATPDARPDARFASARYVLGAPFVRSFIGVPLGAAGGPHIGVLAAGHTEPGRFGPREIERLERVAELAATFLTQRRDAILATRAQQQAEDRLTTQNADLAEALDQAKKANRARSDFMGVMSHELRTPMNAVLSCALLLSQSRLDPVQSRTLGVLEDAGKQMLVLLNDLLDLSSLNAGKVRIEREPVSLVRLIEDAAVIWAADVRAKGLSLSVMIDPSLVSARMVDTARLLQIIGNLMANAIKFTVTGGVTIQAWPERGKGGVERVAIEVEDTGPGVPEEAVNRIFSAFEQADVSTKRRHGGLGLGLHVARRLAEAMGGDIMLETRQDEGSRFTVRIEAPLASPQTKLQPPTAANDMVANDDAELVAREVLCIDDNPRNLYVLGAMLRAAGHRTHECSSGAEGLEVLAARKFDVVLLDMVMPGMDGLDVLAEMRRRGGINAGTPVIACTANVLPDQVEAYRRAGTAGVLSKPIDPRAMLLAVATAA